MARVLSCLHGVALMEVDGLWCTRCRVLKKAIVIGVYGRNKTMWPTKRGVGGVLMLPWKNAMKDEVKKEKRKTG